MRASTKWLATLSLLAGSVLFSSACREDGVMEEAGESIDEAADEIGDEIEDVVD